MNEPPDNTPAGGATRRDFQWDDPFLLESRLGEEERLIRDTARDYAHARLAPRVTDLVGGPENVVFASADPREVEYVIESADGSTKTEHRKPAPDVESVRVRILELLVDSGKALVALNAAMYAADKSDKSQPRVGTATIS